MSDLDDDDSIFGDILAETFGPPFDRADFRALFKKVAAEHAERNRFRHLRDYARSRSSILTKADLAQHLGYLEGWPEAQRAEVEAFKERQAERDAEAARKARREGRGKAAARAFMKERRAFLKTLAKSPSGRFHRRGSREHRR